MKQIWTVTAFTFKDGVRKKAFIITNIIMMVAVLAACILLPRIGGGEVSGEGDYGAGVRCFLLDETDGKDFPGAQALLRSTGVNLTILQSKEQLEDAKATIQENNSDGILQILPGAGKANPPSFRVYAKSEMSSFPQTAAALTRQLNALYRENRLAVSGVAKSEQLLIVPDLAMETAYIGSNVSNMVVGGALMFLMFFAIYYYGASVAMSVATEKSSRVMETLIVSARPGRILLGKCAGAGLLGFMQFGGLMAFSAACVKLLMPAHKALPFELPDLSVGKALLIVLYFILGYALFAMLNSVCGAMVSKMEDINSAMMPINLITVGSFYAGYFSNLMGSSGGGKIMLLIPFTSPFAVPYLLLSETPDAGLIAGSLALLVAGIALVSFVSMRIYAASVLHYGGRLKWKDLARMVKK